MTVLPYYPIHIAASTHHHQCIFAAVPVSRNVRLCHLQHSCHQVVPPLAIFGDVSQFTQILHTSASFAYLAQICVQHDWKICPCTAKKSGYASFCKEHCHGLLRRSGLRKTQDVTEQPPTCLHDVLAKWVRIASCVQGRVPNAMRPVYPKQKAQLFTVKCIHILQLQPCKCPCTAIVQQNGLDEGVV